MHSIEQAAERLFLHPPKPEIIIPSQRELARLEVIDCLAIDPARSHEIDDGISVAAKSSRRSNIGILVARGGLIPSTSELFLESLINGWSRYYGDGSYDPMMGDDELIHELGLEEGKLRPAVLMTLEATRRGVVKRKIATVAVRSQQMSYEEFGHELSRGKHDQIIEAANVLRTLAGQKPIAPNKFIANAQGIDHNLSPEERLARRINQTFMIAGNEGFGAVFAKNNNPYPYRYTELTDYSDYDLGIEAGTSKYQETIRGLYSPYPRWHHFLETDLYTHTTSPLRRAMDLIGHNIIEHSMLGDVSNPVDAAALSFICNHINEMIIRESVVTSQYDM